MKFSIIIPTAFDKCESLLKPCIESIIKYTDLVHTEVIVVANGCTDNTGEYVRSHKEVNVQLVYFSEAIGYSAAINAGVRAAQGEFVIPLNNDTVLLPQQKNLWLDILSRAMWDPSVGISGPWKNWCPFAEREFLIFFVVMVRKSVFQDVGMLDEAAFGPGYGEDCDMCCKISDAGYKIVQVPDEMKVNYDGRMATGNFPIYHAGNETFRNWPDGDKLLAHNREILKKRHCFNTGKAMQCDGFMSEQELLWLAKRAQVETVIEVGSWHGRSSRAIADNLPANGKLYCIDTWDGSITEQETNHVSAKLLDGDHAFDEFCSNLWDHIVSGKVIPLRMHGRHAAKLLLQKGVRADLIFIDGGHKYSEVAEDIKNFVPLRKPGCVISGHDYMQGLMAEVTPAVLDSFGPNIGHAPGTTIWYTDSSPLSRKESTNEGSVSIQEFKTEEPPPIQSPPPHIYDCFTFFNELELLEIRLNELYDVVDRFVIIEATKTHQHQRKPLYFQENFERFRPFLHKITAIGIDFPPNLTAPVGPSLPPEANWALERHQRDAILQGLTGCKDNDVIIISDADEIPSASAIASYKPEMGLCCLSQKLFYYYLNCLGGDWHESKVLPYKLLKEISPCGARYSFDAVRNHGDPIPNGGWHFSFMGGVDRVIQKIQSYSHGEYNTPEIVDPIRLKKALEEATDVFGRKGFKYSFVEMDSSYPKYISENLEKYRTMGWIKYEIRF